VACGGETAALVWSGCRCLAGGTRAAWTSVRDAGKISRRALTAACRQSAEKEDLSMKKILFVCHGNISKETP